LLAFTFPGQGSQRPGMGEAWVDHPSFELVEQASEIAGSDVAELLLRADETALRATNNAQMATFVQSLVVLDAAERLGVEPAVCAGHSLGEYTALVATGSLSFEDGVALVAERGAAMLEAAGTRPGTMAAILGLDDDDAEAACLRAEGDVWVANFNAKGQVIIAGDPDALARAGEIAKGLGARRILSFPVGGAFHTPFMASARERLRKALGSVTFRSPEPVVVANVDARAHGDPADWPGLLSAQLCSPVRWRQTLGTLVDLGATTFTELGPGGVLTGLAKRTVTGEQFETFAVSTPAELEVFVASLTATPPEQIADEPAFFAMAERLVVSPGTGPFRPVEAFAAAAPSLEGELADAGPSPRIAVGELIGWAGETEIRSPFSGSLKGIIVLAGERVYGGQPVAWLRADEEVS
jgi:[acyl-carrier-protein] S-malonyltransferase